MPEYFSTEIVSQDTLDGVKYAVKITRKYEKWGPAFFSCSGIKKIREGTYTIWGCVDKKGLAMITSDMRSALWDKDKNVALKLEQMILKMDIGLSSTLDEAAFG